MRANKDLGFVGGGQMAGALLGGAIRAGLVRAEDTVIAEPDMAKWPDLERRFPGVTLVASADQILPVCRRVILAVKPHVLRAIGAELSKGLTPEHLVVSIAAGVSLGELKKLLCCQRLIRVMPNTPCLVGSGASAIAADEQIDEQDVAWVERFFGAVGTVVRVPDQLMHAVTGVSGSGPAYLYAVIEALSDGGVACGLPRDVATQLAAQTVVGAGRMVLETGLHPGQLKDQVTSPGGTTIAALRTLEAAGLRSALIEAVCRCTDRSRELGEQDNTSNARSS